MRPLCVNDMWHVLHVKPRQEKALAKDLASLSITGFLPLVRHIRIYGKRSIRRALPLFPGYLFLQGKKQDVYRACETRRVVRILPVADQDRLNHELAQLRQATAGGASLEPHPYLCQGQRAAIRAGPLRGLEGIVAARSGREKLVLQVHMLGTAASMEIDSSLLQPLN